MKDELIEIETAVLAKEKGFVGLFPTADYILYADFELDGNGNLEEKQGEDDCRNNFYLAPTQSLLQAWLREKYRMDVQPICTYKQTRFYHLGIIFINAKNQVDTIILKDEGMPTNELFNSYEEALEKGLQEALKLIKIKDEE